MNNSDTHSEEAPICPACKTSRKMVWHDELGEWVCHGTHVRDCGVVAESHVTTLNATKLEGEL